MINRFASMTREKLNAAEAEIVAQMDILLKTDESGRLELQEILNDIDWEKENRAWFGEPEITDVTEMSDERLYELSEQCMYEIAGTDAGTPESADAFELQQEVDDEIARRKS